MAAQASWLDIEPEIDADDDRWHVMMAPGEVKVLTLEQLDDFFRLEIIDESTKVWQPEMKSWLPLGEVAGIESEPKKPAVALAPPTRSAPPPPASVRPPAPKLNPTFASSPSPAQVAAAFAAPASRPPQQAAPAFAPPYVVPAARASAAPPASALFAPVQVPQQASETLRPMASESDISFRSSRSGGGGWLIALAVLLGAGVTSYRNGFVRDVARSSGQEAIYGRLEAAVGGPSFGTLRAVEQLDVSGTAKVAAAAARAPSESPAVSRSVEQAAAKAEPQKAQERPAGAALRLEDLAPAKPEVESPVNAKPAAVRLDALPTPEAAKPVASPAAVKRAPPSAAQAHSSAPAPRAAKRSRSKDPSRMYDPLNPDL